MPKQIRILSIDGGGIRGIIPGLILVHLEKRLQEKTNDPQARIVNYFDFFAGTSTGGILVLLLLCPGPDGRPLFTAQQAVDLYLQRGSGIFTITTLKKMQSLLGFADEKYPHAELEKVLKEYFNDIKLSQLLKPCIITSYEIEKRYAHFFTQHDAKANEGYDFLIRDVARATSAAPTYFETARIRSVAGETYTLIDGGVFANNPALCAFGEASEIFKEEKPVSIEDMVMLSLGTGEVEKKYTYDQARKWGAVGWIKPVIDIMMSGVSETVEFQLSQIFASLGRSDQYLRISPELGKASPDLDNTTAANLFALQEAGLYSAKINSGRIDSLVDCLIKNDSVKIPLNA